MKLARPSMVQCLRRVWWRYHGEVPVVTTFWPQDYPVGTPYQYGAHCYCVTHIARAIIPWFYEIWGKPLPPGARMRQLSDVLIARRPDLMPRIGARTQHL